MDSAVYDMQFAPQVSSNRAVALQKGRQAGRQASAHVCSSPHIILLVLLHLRACYNLARLGWFMYLNT